MYHLHLGMPIYFQGKLVGICGSVGCGKSSLMSAILGRVCINIGSNIIVSTLTPKINIEDLSWMNHCHCKTRVVSLILCFCSLLNETLSCDHSFMYDRNCWETLNTNTHKYA